MSKSSESLVQDTVLDCYTHNSRSDASVMSDDAT